MSTDESMPPKAASLSNTAAARPTHPKHPLPASLDPHNILLFLIGFRLLNALTTRTFFQPDEYFQALEPAWQLAFGEDAGAWITWVR